MKKIFILLSFLVVLSCDNSTQKPAENTEGNNNTTKTEPTEAENVKDKSFDELFKKIEATNITDNVFKLVGQDYTVITSGIESKFNSMTASYGGWGQLFEDPVTWCFLRANRYTLELIRENSTYTMSYFPEQYKDQVMYFGSKSGRDTDKMANITLNSVTTPNGNISYKEAKLIIECKLIELTTVNPNDFQTEKGKKFVEGAFNEAKDYHKLVFGQIVAVWVKK